VRDEERPNRKNIRREVRGACVRDILFFLHAVWELRTEISIYKIMVESCEARDIFVRDDIIWTLIYHF